MDRQQLARSGEKKAAEFLESRDYRILDRNFRCRLGEIDLVARYEETLVFVEVKTRSGSGFGRPAEAVGWSKQRKLRQVAAAYMKLKSWRGPCRFDVVEVWRRQGRFEVRQLMDAF